MGFCQDRILPRLMHLTMCQSRLVPYPSRAAAGPTGRVIEVGIGSGLNLPFYAQSVTEVIGEPSPKLLGFARAAAREADRHLILIGGSAEAIPIESASIETY